MSLAYMDFLKKRYDTIILDAAIEYYNKMGRSGALRQEEIIEFRALLQNLDASVSAALQELDILEKLEK